MASSSPSKSDLTGLLRRWSDGDQAALEELVPLVYQDLRSLARRQLRRERASHTLDTSALVHEAYLRVSRDREMSFRDRVHFFGAAASAMRRVLVDHARSREARKRGRDFAIVPLDDSLAGAALPAKDLLAVDEALKELELKDAEVAQVIELRFFGGLTHEEIAELLGTSLSTVERRWRFGRSFLHASLA